MASQPPETPIEDPRTNAAHVDSANEPNKSEPIPVEIILERVKCITYISKLKTNREHNYSE